MTTKWKRTLISTGTLILALGLAFAAGFLLQQRTGSADGPAITSDLITGEIRSISELATLEYRYTNVGKYEDQLDFYGWKVPFTMKNFIITYDGSMKLGVRADDIRTELSGNEIRISLPPAEILSHEIKEESVEVFDQTKNIFNQIQIEDYTGFAADQKKLIEEKARADGLFEEASARVEEQIRRMLSSWPAPENPCTIVFEAMPDPAVS